MKPVTKIQLFDENGEKFFGEGPCRLLEQVEQMTMENDMEELR